jgi:hypothetical protein
MTDQRQDIETTLSTFEPPGPPDGLRDRVLRRAGAALDRPTAQDRWARIYASRPLRAAWAAMVLVLVVANVLLPRANRRSRESFVEGAAERPPELREVVDVPRLREAYVSFDALTAPAFAGSHRKEKEKTS